jgi:hypothetical protein
LQAVLLASAEKSKRGGTVFHLTMTWVGGRLPPPSGSDHEAHAPVRELFSEHGAIATPPDAQLRVSTRRITKTTKALEVIDLRSSDDEIDDEPSTTPNKRRRVPATNDNEPPAAVKRATKTSKTLKTQGGQVTHRVLAPKYDELKAVRW